MNAETSRPQLRKFGLTVGTALIVFAGLTRYGGAAYLPFVLAGAGGALVLLGLTVPMALRPIEKGWMAVAMVLAWINTRILLTLAFYLLFAPAGLIMRLMRDPLNRAFRTGNSSYWIRRDVKAHDQILYERQF